MLRFKVFNIIWDFTIVIEFFYYASAFIAISLFFVLFKQETINGNLVSLISFYLAAWIAIYDTVIKKFKQWKKIRKIKRLVDDHPIKFMGSNGMVVKCSRADLTTTVQATSTIKGLDALEIASDLIEFGAWHSMEVRPRLSSKFEGYKLSGYNNYSSNEETKDGNDN